MGEDVEKGKMSVQTKIAEMVDQHRRVVKKNSPLLVVVEELLMLGRWEYSQQHRK